MSVALVMGGAECVSDDLPEALSLFRPDAYYAVNEIGIHIEQLDVWCTLHPEFMWKWKEYRAKHGFHANYVTFGPMLQQTSGRHSKVNTPTAVDQRMSFLWPGMTGSGSSGLFAVKVALEYGKHDGVVLAGVPMDPQKNHFLRPGEPWKHYDSFLPGWTSAMPRFKDRVRSMSGWTRKVLGSPTAEWLRDVKAGMGRIPHISGNGTDIPQTGISGD